MTQELHTHISENFLQLHNLSIGYHAGKKEVTVQENLNLSANKGELIALIGRNGCGKSTLLRSMSWLQPIHKGKIVVDGNNLSEITPRNRAQLISVVLTDQRAEASFNVKELISIGRDPYTGWLGSLSEEDNKIIENAIEMTNLQGFENRNINELSDGERQRVFIARALAQNTSIILLDEPTSHLDLPNRISILLLLQRLARETNKTIFISTHELETAMQVADKIWLMKKLDGVKVGTPEDMVLQGTFDTVFSHSNYDFDKEYGSFVIKNQLNKYITTIVENPNSLTARWTTKALSRKGYHIINNASISVTINETNNTWTISNQYDTKIANNIEEMLRMIALFSTQL